MPSSNVKITQAFNSVNKFMCANICVNFTLGAPLKRHDYENNLKNNECNLEIFCRLCGVRTIVTFFQWIILAIFLPRMHGSNFLVLRPDNIFAPYTLCKHFDHTATFSTCICEKLRWFLVSLSLLFLVYGFSRRMAWDGSCGEFAQDSVTIYFMAHILVASRMRRLQLPESDAGYKIHNAPSKVIAIFFLNIMFLYFISLVSLRRDMNYKTS